MTVREKRAWVGVGASLLALVGYAVLIPVMGPERACGAFAAIALFALSALIGRRELSDERDRSITRRALSVGARASYAVFVAGCLAVWAVAHAKGHDQVPTYAVTTIVWFGAAIFLLVQNVAVLFLYRGHVEADHG